MTAVAHNQAQVIAAPSASFRGGQQGRRAKGQPLLVSLVGVFVFYCTLLLFVGGDCFNIGNQKSVDQAEVVTIMGVAPKDIGLALILGFAMLTSPGLRQALKSKFGRFSIGLLIAYTFLGIVFGNELNWVREDLRVWGWGLGGLALFHVLITFRRPSFHLLMICLISGLVLYLSAEGGKNSMSNDAYLGGERLWDLNVFSYSGMMVPLLGLIVCLCTLKNAFYFTCSMAALLIFFYSAVIVGATRSLAIALLLVCALAAPSLLFTRDKEKISRRVGGAAPWVAGLLLAMGLLVVATFLGLAFSSSTVLADRLTNSSDIDSGLDRFVELSDGLNQLGLFRAIIGGGLGFTIESIFNYTAIGTHIGIFTFLFKFGVLPFVAITVYLYVFLPLKLIRAIFAPRSMSINRRTAVLVTLPGILGWALLLAISGGYGTYSFIGLGLLIGVFAEVSSNGLTRVCR